jgi:pimeloyl-ACP methyl ester carboxylesterase
MSFLGQDFRTYALDFWGFGESGKKRSTYHVQDFVSLVDQFMEKLGISSAPLVGHSMGGTVSLGVALNFPERVERIVVIGSPIAGSSLALIMKMAGYRTVAFFLFTFFPAFRFGMRMASPLICKDPHFPHLMDRDLSKTTLESFLISIASLRRTDLRTQLQHISTPVMGMYGDRDIIVNPNQWKPLLVGVPQARIERFRTAGHFIMLDDPLNFRSKLKDFLSKPPGVN